MNLKKALTILLIDDNSTDRETFRQDLLLGQNCQYNIVEATSGTEGLTWCHRLQPDVIFLDYQLPDMNGLKFLKQLRELTKKYLPPVIMLLEPENEAIAIKTLEAGAKGYVDKGQVISEELQLMLLMTVLLNCPTLPW